MTTGATRRELLQPQAWLRAAGALEATGQQARGAAQADTTPPPAPVAERAMPDAELQALIAGHGLEHRLDQIRQLARHSARLVPDPAGGTWVARVTDGSLCRREGGRLVTCAVDARHLGLALPTLAGRAGTLVLSFDDKPLRSASHGLVDCGTATARLAEPGEAHTWPGGLRMSAGLERSLPRVWSAAVAPLRLDGDEAARYARLRKAVAHQQAAALFDAAGADCSLDRVLGYPDETTGLMPERCGGDPGNWQLLVQLTTSGWRGLGWRTRPERIYCWTSVSDTLGDVRVFAQ